MADVESDAETLERLVRDDREKLRDLWDTCMPKPPSEEDLDDPDTPHFLVTTLNEDEIAEFLEELSV